MTTEEVTDVNLSAEVESDPAQQEVEGTQSAETLNTDSQDNELPESIPYERFKEVNDKSKAYKEQLDEYESKKELLEIYGNFDRRLKEDPEKALEELREFVLKESESDEVAEGVDTVEGDDKIAQLTNKLNALENNLVQREDRDWETL